MRDYGGKTSRSCAGHIVQPPASGICAACIETSGLTGHSLTNVERMMAVADGEAVGLNIRSPMAALDWIDAVDGLRCRCFLNDTEVWVPRSSLADR